jgi:hypothetical protein
MFCNSTEIEKIFKEDYKIALGCYPVEENDISHFMPFNVVKCLKCRSFQTAYQGDLNIIYNYKANFVGTIRGTMNTKFSNFILDNKNIQSIIEIGAGNGSLSEQLLEMRQMKYTIIDPTYSGKTDNRTIYKQFFEEVDEAIITEDTIVMSHVFEHFYRPLDIIEKIAKCPTIKYIYINIPNLESCIKDNNYHVLNPEHIFYIENNFVEQIFNKSGFALRKTYKHEKHSIFFEFKRDDSVNKNVRLLNITSDVDVKIFFDNILNRIDYIHNEISKLQKDTPVYIWPCSMHTVYLTTFGLDLAKINGVLDNSEHKIGKYLYGTKLKCSSLNEMMNITKPIAIILNGGCYNQEISINNDNIKII